MNESDVRLRISNTEKTMFVMYAITNRVFGIYLLQDWKQSENRGAYSKYKSVGYTAAPDLILAVPVNPEGEHIGC